MKVKKLSESLHFNNSTKVILEEELLTEAPAIVDKIKKGIDNITKSTDEKELAKANKQKSRVMDRASTLLAKDLASKNSGSTFYIDHNYSKGMNQDEWKQWVAKIAKLEENPKNEATVAKMRDQRANAIVVDAAGFYMRKGLENLENKFVRFIPGKGDELGSLYHTDSYSYKKSVKKASSSNSKLDTRKLQDLCKLTGVQILGADKKPLTMDAIARLTMTEISNLQIQANNHAPVEMKKWMVVAHKAGLI